MKQQQGFTLIELIVVIVILGILAATALPKFTDLSTDARKAAVQGVAGAIASSASIRKAANAISSVAYPYAAASACAGSYLETAIDTTQFTVTGSTSCSVQSATDTAISSVVALPS